MISKSTNTSQGTGLALLIDWAIGQDNWIQKLVTDVIKTQRRLSDERIAILYALLLCDKELTQGDSPIVEPLPASQVSSASPTNMRLISLKHIGNVNALARDQEIEFHKRLTICYGENASGKTGYVRVLKRAAAVRTADPILPNIHGGGFGQMPQVRIKIVVDDEERVINWQGEQGIQPLTHVDVFDARAAVVHLADDLTYSYTPGDLSLFPLVSDGIERVKVKLQDEREERKPPTNASVNHFQRQTSLYAKIEGLGPSTDLEELEALAQVSAEDETSLPGLCEKVAALESGSVQQQIEGTIQEQDTLAGVLSIAETISGFDRDAYQEAIVALRTARFNHEQATQEALIGEHIPGILGDAWHAFVEAAEDYIREIGLDPYPELGDPCIYCRQPLHGAAVGLVRKYRDYCNAALRQAVEQARERIQTFWKAVSNLRLDETARAVDRISQALPDPLNQPATLTAAQEVIQHARLLYKAMAAEEDCPITPESLREAEKTVRTAAKVADTTLTNLRKQGEERETALAEEQARLMELQARLTLRELMPTIRDHVQAARWVDRSGAYLRSFQGIKRSLTDTAKRGSAEVMNRHFQERFREECDALCAPQVTLDFPGREGESRRRKLLTPEYGLDEVLSEGEQKAIALADFLAEATLKPDRSPIVFDDPVTSLDHKRLRHVVNRVVELSRHRQVIVFTHDIWFAAELLGCLEREPNECAFYDVTAEDQRIGLVERGSHPRTDTFNDRKRKITTLISEAAKETGETRQALVEKGYEELRGACEIVVEKDLLKGVTERYRPNVRMTVLDQIRADRLPSARRRIVQVFDSCCRFIASHSQPLVTRGVRPTLDDLKDDWKTLQDARREYLR